MLNIDEILRSPFPMLLNPHCPCGTQKHYTDCCKPYLDGLALAPTAEALMRSRYTAYSKNNLNYLIHTQHPTTRKKTDPTTLQQTFETTRWVSLTILKTQQGQPHHKRGIVEFIATHQEKSRNLKQQPTLTQLHERSRFIQENQHWFYVDGDLLPPL